MSVSQDSYDVVIIGAGMSGMAAAIRLGMYGHSVLLLERHTAPGGLNSFYRLDGYSFDVGLHALTNYVPEGVRGTPLGKIFRQLRIPRDAFDLSPQLRSCIRFPGLELGFTNEFEYFRTEVVQAFPAEKERFDRFVQFVRDYHAVNLDPDSSSAREEIAKHLKDPLLIEMLMCPLMYYGSAREEDMDFGQFVVLFQAIFLEGFARPFEGVRKIIKVLLKRVKEVGVERRMGLGVTSLVSAGGGISSIELDDGSVIQAKHVVSTIGAVETEHLVEGFPENSHDKRVGQLSFTEAIAVTKQNPRELGFEDTIVFFNDSDRFDYRRPDDLIDYRSGVICVPNNYDYADGQDLKNGILRVTSQANYDLWKALPDADYKQAKEVGFERLMETAVRMTPGVDLEALTESIEYRDMFSPTTITRYTGHYQGAVYGAPKKIKDGSTAYKNLYLCGTDQGFLGIVGAMLSGISIVNYHILKG